MKALLIKDLLTLKGQAKSLLLVLAVWFIISYINGSGLFFTALSVIYGMLLPLTTLSVDEKSRVERYMMSAPVTRAELALSRYALGILGLLTLGVLGVGACLVIGDSLEEALGASAACFCLAVLLLGVTLPLVYKFGTDKARIISSSSIWSPPRCRLHSEPLRHRARRLGRRVLPPAASEPHRPRGERRRESRDLQEKGVLSSAAPPDTGRGRRK